MKNLRILTIALILFIAAAIYMKRNNTDSAGSNVERLSGKTHDVAQGAELSKSHSNTPNSTRLRNAYTGQWFKNAAYEAEKDQSLEFSQPENTRNQVGAVAKKNDTKKKSAKANKKRKSKITKIKSKTRTAESLQETEFQNDYVRPQAYGTNGPAQAATQAPENEKLPPLTLEQWMDLLKKGEGFSQLVSDFKSKKVTGTMFYAIIDKLMQSSDLTENQLGYKLLAATPSLKSFRKHIEYMNQEQESELQSFAKEQLAIYKTVANIRFLNSTLKSKTPALRSAAILLIKELAESLVATLDTSTSTGNEDEIRAPSSVVMRYKSVLQKTLTTINLQLASGTLDGESTTQFTQVKNLLERILAVTHDSPPTI